MNKDIWPGMIQLPQLNHLQPSMRKVTFGTAQYYPYESTDMNKDESVEEIEQGDADMPFTMTKDPTNGRRHLVMQVFDHYYDAFWSRKQWKTMKEDIRALARENRRITRTALLNEKREFAEQQSESKLWSFYADVVERETELHFCPESEALVDVAREQRLTNLRMRLRMALLMSAICRLPVRFANARLCKQWKKYTRWYLGVVVSTLLNFIARLNLFKRFPQLPMAPQEGSIKPASVASGQDLDNGMFARQCHKPTSVTSVTTIERDPFRMLGCCGDEVGVGAENMFFSEACLLDVLRWHGIFVPYRDGPLWALGDGNMLLASFGKSLRNIAPSMIAPGGAYVLNYAKHFSGMKVYDTAYETWSMDDLGNVSQAVVRFGRRSNLYGLQHSPAITWYEIIDIAKVRGRTMPEVDTLGGMLPSDDVRPVAFSTGGMRNVLETVDEDILYPTQERRLQGVAPSPMSPASLAPFWRNVGVDVVRMFVEESGFRTIAYHPPASVELFEWGVPGGHEYHMSLSAGAYAVARCAHEHFLRVLNTDPVPLGLAGGHVTLACEEPVLFAGEVEVSDANQIIAWTLVSGTYRLPMTAARQSQLPITLLWEFIDASDAPTLPANITIRKLRDGSVLVDPSFQRSRTATSSSQHDRGPRIFHTLKRSLGESSMSPGQDGTKRPKDGLVIELSDSGSEQDDTTAGATFRNESAYIDHVLATYIIASDSDIEDDLKKDVMIETDGYSDIIASVLESVDDLMGEPHTLPFSPKQRLALIVIRWLCLPHSHEQIVLNDCILCKLLLGEEARAHIDGVYITMHCVWRRQTKFDLKHVRELTQTMFLTRAYLGEFNKARVGSNWGDVETFLTGEQGRALLQKGDDHDLSVSLQQDAAANDDGGEEEIEENGLGERTMWLTRLKTLLRYQKSFMGNKQQLDRIIANMVNYFQVPRAQEPVVSCDDACVRLHWGRKFTQIPRDAKNNCYIRIPAELTLKFSVQDERRQDLFIATCFWNKRGIHPRVCHHVDLCYTILVLAGTGRLMPSVAVAYTGKGENGKTRWAQSKIRLLGGECGGCDFVDPRVLFDAHEWRVNMGNFLNFLGIIFDEAGDTSGNAQKPLTLLASLIKLLIDRKKVIVRPPYAREAEQHAFLRTALFLLSNTFPSIPEERARAWRAWYRRFLVLPQDSTFVTSLDATDPSSGRFLSDVDLENFVTSGLYAAMYLKRHVQRQLMKLTEIECIKICRAPPRELDEFRKEVIGNAMMNTLSCDEDKQSSRSVINNEQGCAAGSNPESGAAGRNPETLLEEAQRIALELARERILTIVPSRANKITQLGQPMNRVGNLEKYLSTGVFVRRQNSNGRYWITYTIPIKDVPASLQTDNWRHGKLVYEASIDYACGAK